MSVLAPHLEVSIRWEMVIAYAGPRSGNLSARLTVRVSRREERHQGPANPGKGDIDDDKVGGAILRKAEVCARFMTA